MIDTNPIGTRRFQNQYLNVNSPIELPQLLQKMGPIQAQDYEMMLWAIGIRTGLKRETIEQSVLQGKIIRTHLLRPTWHIVNANQIYDLLSLSAPNIKKSLRSRHAKLGIDDAVVQKSNRLLEKALSGKQQLTREELKPILLGAGLDLSENRFYHLLLRAALDGLICGGVPKGNKQSYTLLPELLPPQSPKAEVEILHDLASYYFKARGPARLKDFSWWAGLKQKQAKAALNTVADSLVETSLEGETYYDFVGQTEVQADEGVYFLPAYDEFIIAYQDKTRLLLKPEHLSLVAKSGVFYPMIVYRGMIVGRWKAKSKREWIEIEYQIFEGGPKLSLSQLEAGLAAYSHFVERSVEWVSLK